MKRVFKLLLFLIASIIFLVIALFVRIGHYVVLKNPQRALSMLTTIWAKVMVWIVTIKVILKGDRSIGNEVPYLIISNHQSYLDIIIIASKIQTLFVAKMDVQSWPILGWLASLGGTLYIDRKAFRGAKDSIRNIEKVLENSICVTIFPEGTSSNGETIFPFRPALFNAALATKSKLLPMTLNYEVIDNLPVSKANRDFVCWYGDMTFAKHFWEVLRLDSIEVSILIHPVIITTDFPNAKELSTVTHNTINKGFNRFMS